MMYICSYVQSSFDYAIYGLHSAFDVTNGVILNKLALSQTCFKFHLINYALYIFMYIMEQVICTFLLVSIDQDNSTVAVGCRSRQLIWCREIPQLLLSQYIIGLLIMAAGYATSILPTFTLYSRLLGPHPQV